MSDAVTIPLAHSDELWQVGSCNFPNLSNILTSWPAVARPERSGLFARQGNTLAPSPDVRKPAYKNERCPRKDQITARRTLKEKVDYQMRR